MKIPVYSCLLDDYHRGAANSCQHYNDRRGPGSVYAYAMKDGLRLRDLYSSTKLQTKKYNFSVPSLNSYLIDNPSPFSILYTTLHPYIYYIQPLPI